MCLSGRLCFDQFLMLQSVKLSILTLSMRYFHCILNNIFDYVQWHNKIYKWAVVAYQVARVVPSVAVVLFKVKITFK